MKAASWFDAILLRHSNQSTNMAAVCGFDCLRRRRHQRMQEASKAPPRRPAA
jgi:hypothetical protein